MLVLIRGVEPRFLLLNFFSFLTFTSSVLLSLSELRSQILLIILIVGFPSIINQQTFQFHTPLFSILLIFEKQMLLLIVLLQFVSLKLSGSQVVFSQDFENYDTGINKIVYLAFNGTWYRQDVNKLTGLFKIKGPNALIASKYLAVFSESNTSTSCIDVTLTVGSVYSLAFDHTWESFSTFTLFAEWNNATILSFSGYGSEGVFIHQAEELPAIGSSTNVLCFSGAYPMSGIRIGPVVDNIRITYLRSNAIPTNNTVTGNSSNVNLSTPLTNNSHILAQNSSNISIISNNTSSVNNEPRQLQISSTMLNELQSIHLEWVKEFVIKFNLFLKFTSIFGFSYLISNLLNFWNIIVLYYFVELQSFLGVYKIQLEGLCKISLQEGSLLSLISKSANGNQFRMPQEKYEKISPTTTDWPSFWELGFTSQIIVNNIELYLEVISCIFKLFLIKTVLALIRKFKPCISSLFYGIHINYTDILCYQIISSFPSMVIPIAIMLSRHSSTAYASLHEKINNSFQVFVILVAQIGILLPILLKKKLNSPIEPKKPVVKSSIFVQSKHETIISIKSVRKTIACTKKITKKAIEQQQFFHKMFQYRKQVRYHKFLNWGRIIDMYDQILFFTIPFLIGLQCKLVFFLTNFAIIGRCLIVQYKNGPLIRQFKSKQYWFGMSIKIIFLSIHFLFFLLYLQDLQIMSFSLTTIALIDLICLFLIIAGAFVETFHTITNLVVWFIEIVKKIRLLSGNNKIVNKQEKVEKPLERKTMNLIHIRKESQLKLNQVESIIESVGQQEPQKKVVTSRSIAFRKVGMKTKRLTKIGFERSLLTQAKGQNQPEQKK